MTAMLSTLGVAVLLTALGCLLVVVLGVLPFVLGVDLAERRGFSTERWGAVTLLGTAVMAVGAYAVVTADGPVLLLLVCAALGWSGPLALLLLDPVQRRIGGSRGAHQR